MKVLVTGATGFVGKEIVKQLLLNKVDVIAAVRNGESTLPSGVQRFITGEFSKKIDWLNALNDVDVIIHCAARVHVMNDVGESDPLRVLRNVNVDNTLSLARQAIGAKVKRFIFISSIKVNGEVTLGGEKFKDDTVCLPIEPYGVSKYEAEQGLLALVMGSNMEVVIIRPPLVYGPEVSANFNSMIKWVRKELPLPFGKVCNQRSLIALDNLVSFIIHCIDHPKATNEVFLVSDGEDVSTSELLRKVAKAFGKKMFLLPVPVGVMIFCATLAGKRGAANRLFSSLQIDSSKARNLLGWKPVITMDDQLKKIADTYIEN
ncbi:MAG: NAD-dependent epimerase/dehydratase family protein [Methylococcaceae bacterium]|nr:NAD-dependent epimerase/dehydratase family protein [Methylococcaceae bacterium]